MLLASSLLVAGLGGKSGLIAAACCAESLLQPGTAQQHEIAFSPRGSTNPSQTALSVPGMYHLSEGIVRGGAQQRKERSSKIRLVKDIKSLPCPDGSCRDDRT